jgi:hypothetical protein
MIRITDTPNTTQSDTTRIRDLKLMDLPLAGSGADGALISYQSIGDRPPSFFDRPSFFFFFTAVLFSLRIRLFLCRWFEISFTCLFFFSFFLSSIRHFCD